MHTIDVTPAARWPVDPALLPVLEALLRQRSVTRAAAVLGLEQSTVSHALARLRSALGDPLFVRTGRDLTATPRAEAIAPALFAALDATRRALSDESAFDPATSRRRFTLASPDILAALLPPLLSKLEREAPTTRLELRSSGEIDAARALSDGAVDVAVGVARDVPRGCVQRIVGSARWCVLARKGHPAIDKRGKLSIERWVRYGHIRVRTMGGPSLVEEALTARGHTRKVAFVAPSFLVAPMVVAKTDLFFATPTVLAEPMTAALGLVMLAPPVEIAPVSVAVYWHERMDTDGGHRWFRRALAEAIEGLLRADRTPRTTRA
ncbi:MAG: LysR family transcriptional regulator [Myxococcales bacterium]|nr:LysR family transcriptional regulator [Myxococcales bacterium]